MEDTERQGGRFRAPFVAVLAAGLVLNAPIAGAVDFRLSDDDLGWGNWGDISFTWNTRLTAGVQVRTERRDHRLVDKQNVPANQDIAVEGDTFSIIPSPVLDFLGATNPLPGSNPTGPDFMGRFDLCEIGLSEWWGWTGGTSLNASTDCFSQVGDPRPSMRLLNAPGGFNINGDDGNLNYDRGDITYANFQVRSELTAHWRNLTAKISGIGYYDPVNNDFDTHLADRKSFEYFGRNFDITTTNGPPPMPDGAIYPLAESITIDRMGYTQRQDDEEDRLGEQLRLLEAFLAYDFDIAGRKLRIGVGDQRMRWGESTFMIFNNLARINPPSAELYDRPGTEVRDAFIPVGMVTASMNLTTNFNFEAFYQYDWEPVEPSVCGSFLSISDVAGCGDGPTPIYLASGNAPEAPNADFRLGGLSGTQTNTSRTIYLEDESFGYPDDGGQFGLRLDYYADWLNGGTELSLYGMNIHSRLPFFSVLAAECKWNAWDAPNNETPCPFGDSDTQSGNVLEAERKWRVDSMRAFLDYPEDIRIFGMSATTNLGDWSLAGEIAYSPNQPAQVSLVDVVYAGVQPAFLTGIGGVADEGPLSGDDIDMPFSGGVVGTSGSGVPGLRRTPVARLSVPDYLMSRYRCDISNADLNGDTNSEAWENEVACSDAIRPGQYIRGYERLKVGQISMTGIRVLGGSSPISAAVNADQIIIVGEWAATKVFDMPGLDELQFQSASASMTHYSQGQAEWEAEEYGPFVAEAGGANGVTWEADEPIVDHRGQLRQKFVDAGFETVDELCTSTGQGSDGLCYRRLGPTDRLNPQRADEDNFADDFATDYRVRAWADYNNGPFGWKWTPGFTFYHDVYGNSIYPGQDFVEDRKRLTLSTDILFTNNFSGNFQYRFYWGAGDRNLRLDRDYAELSLSYAF